MSQHTDLTGKTLHVLTTLEPACPAKLTRWPQRQCQLIAGHDGDHQARSGRKLFSWRTGSRA